MKTKSHDKRGSLLFETRVTSYMRIYKLGVGSVNLA
jgi:hypothetical protein